jgi:hypothetical protein
MPERRGRSRAFDSPAPGEDRTSERPGRTKDLPFPPDFAAVVDAETVAAK